MIRTLVLGGTGPSGPHVVEGLVARGHRVTVLHGGQHEAELPGDVEHLHGDVHFKATLDEALGRREFDLVIAMYGRLRETAEWVVGRSPRLIGVGTAAGMAGPRDPRWGLLGRPAIVPDAARIPVDPSAGGILGRVQAAADRLFELHDAGHVNATLLGYASLYGARQIAPEDWCVVRRILDGRRRLVIADGGLKIQQRTYVEHAAQAVLRAVDQPEASAGRFYAVGELPLYTLRQRIEAICRLMGADVELVDLPWELATPAHYLWGRNPAHTVLDDAPIRKELGFAETIPVEVALEQTVRWLVDHRAQDAAEWELQIDDTFDYAGEDELIGRWQAAQASLAAVRIETRPPAHRYRHPRTPGEGWSRPERAKR